MHFNISDIMAKVFMWNCVLLIVRLLVRLGRRGFISIRNANLTYKGRQEIATVRRLEHKDAYTTTTFIFVSNNKIMVPQKYHRPEEYNIYLVYDGKKYCFDNEKWFNYLKVGDSVDVIVHEGRNKKGEILNTYLTLRNR